MIINVHLRLFRSFVIENPNQASVEFPAISVRIISSTEINLILHNLCERPEPLISTRLFGANSYLLTLDWRKCLYNLEIKSSDPLQVIQL